MKNLILIIAVVLYSLSVTAQIFQELESYPVYDDYGYHPFFGEPYKSETNAGILFVYKQTLSTIDIDIFFDEVDRVLSPHGLHFNLTRNKAIKMGMEDINNDIEYKEFYYMSDTVDDFFYLEIQDGIIAFYVGFEK